MRVFRNVLGANRKRLASLEPAIGSVPSALVLSSDARHFHTNGARDNGHSRDGHVQLVITSPPYPGAQKYIRASSLSLGWLGLCRSDELISRKMDTIGREEIRRTDYVQLATTNVRSADRILEAIHRKDPIRAAIASTYLLEMRAAIREIWRVLSVGGHFVLVAANNQICGHEFRTQHYLRLIAEETGFSHNSAPRRRYSITWFDDEAEQDRQRHNQRMGFGVR